VKIKKTISPLNKITGLLEACQIDKFFNVQDLIAIKTHFGEMGNTAFLRPIYFRPIIDKLKTMGIKPFLTDTNTVYVGMRTNSVDHLHNAYLNGFNYSTLQVPVIIADGLRGESIIEIETGLDLVKQAKLGSEIVRADGMIVVSHFKGHEVSGFGGAIKNLSMGCAARAGKMEMHSSTKPYVEQANCTACGQCASHCGSDAIDLSPKAVITDKCIGCARCIAVCPEHTIKIDWNESCDNTMKKMVEYAYATHLALKGKIVYINIMTSISPACDCYPGNDQPLTSDIGFAASMDPIALDKACWDLVIKKMNKDPFKELYNYLDPQLQFDHSQAIGFGNLQYELSDISC